LPAAERKTAAELQTELAALLPQALTRVLKAVGQALSPANPAHRTFPLPRPSYPCHRNQAGCGARLSACRRASARRIARAGQKSRKRRHTVTNR
jgi:hypothetical protein